MNLAVISPSIRCSSVIHVIAGPPVPEWSALARLELRIEDSQLVREGVLVDHAVEILEEEGQRLALVEPRLLTEFAQAAIAVLGHRRVEAARQAKAFRHRFLLPSGGVPPHPCFRMPRRQAPSPAPHRSRCARDAARSRAGGVSCRNGPSPAWCGRTPRPRCPPPAPHAPPWPSAPTSARGRHGRKGA